MAVLHRDRYTLTNVHRIKNGIIIHDSESGDGSCDSLIAALSGPKTQLPNGTYNVAGYHAVTDGKGGYIQIATAEMGPYHAPPTNETFWAVCMPGRAAQTRAEWLDPLSLNHIKGVARFACNKWAEDGQRYPLRFADAFGLISALGSDATTVKTNTTPVGYSAHAQVSRAWHKTDHTDPGVNFPWDILAAEIAKLQAKPPLPAPPPPVEGDDMAYVIFQVDASNDGINNPDSFGGLGAPLVGADGKPTGGYLVPTVEWLSPARYAAYAPHATLAYLSKSDLVSCSLLGPFPAGYSAANFASVHP